MDLFERVSEDIKTAMKAKDKVALETLRNIKKVFLEAKTAPGANDTTFSAVPRIFLVKSRFSTQKHIDFPVCFCAKSQCGPCGFTVFFVTVAMRTGRHPLCRKRKVPPPLVAEATGALFIYEKNRIESVAP